MGYYWYLHDKTGKNLHNELSKVYSSPNIITKIKTSIIRWAGHAACRGRREMFSRLWLEGLKGREHSEDQRVEGEYGVILY
jgi:hypothetical protein